LFEVLQREEPMAVILIEQQQEKHRYVLALRQNKSPMRASLKLEIDVEFDGL
jgi:hypothetical protein